MKKIKLLIVCIILIIIKIIFNNFYIPNNFFWYPFENYKNREYLLEWEYGCKIIEVGENINYYYGKVNSGGMSLYKTDKRTFAYDSCENEYFLIKKTNFSEIEYFKNKEDILKIIKNYKVKEPYKFFMYRIF